MKPNLLRIAAAIAGILLSTQAYAATDEGDDTATTSTLPKAEVESIIKDYIMKHPEVIQQSFMEMQKKEQEKRMAAMKKGAIKYKKELMGDDKTPTVGNAAATVTVTEFYDFHCGYCKQMVPTITKLLDEDKNVRVVFKDFPILAPDSDLAAKASIAFYSLDKDHYMDFYTELMKATGHFDDKSIDEAAAKFGVKEEAMKDAMAKPEVAAAVAKNKELAKNLMVSGTPAIFVGTDVMAGAASYEDLVKAIKKAREKKS